MIYLGGKTIVCPEVPPVKGTVRAECICGGWVLETIEENLTKVVYFTLVLILMIG